jgi:hypothetical protein
MAYNIGLNVIEVEGAGAPAIVGAAVGNGGFNVLTERGIPNRPVRVTSFAHFEDSFGGFIPSALGAYLVKGFFDNGGQVAWVNRVLPSGATPSTIDLNDGANAAALTLQTGNLGQADPGSWGQNVSVRVRSTSSFTARLLETARATISGDQLAATTDMTGLVPLSVLVDGETTPTTAAFQLGDFADPAAATPDEIVNAINGSQTKITASLSDDAPPKLVLTSTGQSAHLNKTFSSLQVQAANAPLKLTTGADPTFGAAANVGANSTRLSSVEGLQAGSALLLTNGANIATVKLTVVDASTNTITWATALPTPANFAGPETVITTLDFELAVARGGTAASNIVETWPGLTLEPELPSYAPTVLNDSLVGSRYVVASDPRTASPLPPGELPRAIGFTALTAGSSGNPTVNDFVGDAAAHTGFSAFDPINVQLLCTERTDPAVVVAALAYCENRGDCMFVGSVPQASVGAGQAIPYGQAFQAAKVYGALYGPWIKVLDPVGSGANPSKWLPATGHVMGVCARIASARGVWKAPAGDEAVVLGALDVETQLSDADHTDLVESGSVNGIRAVAGAGICVDASRTLSTDTRWLYVNVRLLFNFVKSSLRSGLRWVRQEPNRDTLWTAIKFSSVTPFLTGLWRQGAFGTGKPQDVFTVICDATNNPPDQVNQGILKVEVYFYPSRPAETIVIIVGQQPSGATAAEA